MKSIALASATAALLVATGVAHAAKIASPAAYAGTNQRAAECWIRNLGTTPMTVDAIVYGESGEIVSRNGSCGSPIEPGSACLVFAQIANGVAYACSATVPNAKNVRGTLVLKDVNDVALRSAELR